MAVGIYYFSSVNNTEISADKSTHVLGRKEKGFDTELCDAATYV